MDLHWALVLLSLFWALDAQLTGKRACDCAYTVDGRCAYTLLLPGQNTCPKDSQNMNPMLEDSVNTIQQNLTDLFLASGEQARMLSQVQSIVLDQQTTIANLQSKIAENNDNANNNNNMDNNGDESSAMSSSLSDLQSRIEGLETQVSSISSSPDLEDITNDVNTLKSQAGQISFLRFDLQRTMTSLDILTDRVNTLTQEVQDLQSNLWYCTKKGLLVSGNVSNIADDKITVSSSFSEDHGAPKARINSSSEQSFGAWCPDNSSESEAEPNQDEWIQFDFGSVRVIYAIVTRGRADYTQWVVEYKIMYNIDADNTTWVTYKDVIGEDELFAGNTDQNKPKVNTLWQPIRTDKIRIMPTDGYNGNNKCMRADVIGCVDQPIRADDTS